MADAICMQCGATKKEPWRRCRRCGFDPTTEEEALVKSVYLSIGRFENPKDKDHYKKTLDNLAKAIENGQCPEFEEAELSRLRNQKMLMDKVQLSAVWLTVLRFFLPGIIFLGILFIILFLIKFIR